MQTIDQTASEVQLHRVLWLVKFLRAMVLHVVLAGVAAVVFFSTGIDSIYPLATDTIHAIRVQIAQDHLDGGQIGAMVYAVVASALFAAILALLVWVYLSITNVRRYALRLQAVLFLSLYAWIAAGKWREVTFALANLDFLFAVLAALGVGFTTLVFPLAVVYALWGVSRSPERSSFVATLDPRLAPSAWTYLNKLLDLPRTPLRRLSTAAAYALAFAGALLLIASMMYLITAGGASNKVAMLAIECAHPELISDCIARSSRWGREIPLALVLALAGVKVAALLQSTAKRLGGLSVADVIKRPDEQFLLYLRPFDTDDVILPTPRLPLLSRLVSFRPFPVRVEEELFDVADGYRPLIAIGKPGDTKAVLGGLAYRAYLEDSQWQDYVAEKIRRAQRIVMLVKDSDGVRWELARIFRDGAALKTLFLVDPAVRTTQDWDTLTKFMLPLLQGERMTPPGFAFQSQPIGFFFQCGSMVEIVNANRTATSYRTAFSYFLTESHGAS